MSIAYNYDARHAPARRWKGKAREIDPDPQPHPERRLDPRLGRRDVEGTGGADGIVLPLDMVGTGVYDVAYTIPVQFGSSSTSTPQQFSLQIDTGSSDLWVASTSCSTSSCKLTAGHLYDPSASISTGKTFSIPYLAGSAAGPIVWDEVSLGGYAIDTQAMAAASSVTSEPLSSLFSGILGLALPLNSIIAQTIPPVTSNAPDGAAFASNLFSLTPPSVPPSARFISLSLSRPESDGTPNEVPALLGIGRHPAALVPDPSKVLYDGVVSEKAGALYWKAVVSNVTVYVGGEARRIDLSATQGEEEGQTTAVLDSGVPVILATPAIANAVYGALGISPASDGNYYVPCSTPLNMTITLDSRPEIPLHPLDLTAYPEGSSSASVPTTCIGLIQASSALSSTDDTSSDTNAIGDMILGVPFLRSVYTVMGYTLPLPNGSFPVFTAASLQEDGGLGSVVRPRLGLLSLVNSTTALAEFNTVRVLNQPLATSGSGSNSSSATGSAGDTKTVNVGGKKLSVGVLALIGLLAFFGLCVALFGVRWAVYRRRFRKNARRGDGDRDRGVGVDRKTAYMLTRRGDSADLTVGLGGGLGGKMGGLGEGLTEDERRQIRYQAFLRKENRGVSDMSDGTLDSERTLKVDGGEWKKTAYGEAGDAHALEYGEEDAEFGLRTPRPRSGQDQEDSDSDRAAWGAAADQSALTDTQARSKRRPQTPSGMPDVPLLSSSRSRAESGASTSSGSGAESVASSVSPPSSPDAAHFPSGRPGQGQGQVHGRVLSVAVPLLLAVSADADVDAEDMHRNVEAAARPDEHRHAYSESLDEGMQDGSQYIVDWHADTHMDTRRDADVDSYPDAETHTQEEAMDSNMDGQELGVGRASMAGIGSASARRGQFVALPFNRDGVMRPTGS